MRLLINAALASNFVGHPSSLFTSVSRAPGDPHICRKLRSSHYQWTGCGSSDEDVENTTRWLMSSRDGYRQLECVFASETDCSRLPHDHRT